MEHDPNDDFYGDAVDHETYKLEDGGTPDCFWLGADKGVCWGLVKIVDYQWHDVEDDERPVALCRGHQNLWPENDLGKGEYVPKPAGGQT